MPLSQSTATRLQHQHELISDLIRGLSEKQLQHRTIPDKWSAFEQLVHLTAYQPSFSSRLKAIEQEEVPVFEPYMAEKDPLFHECLKLPLKELLENLHTQRFIIFNHVNALSEQTLRRTGRHRKYGPLTIVEWTEFFLVHEAHHLYKLFQLTAEARSLLHQS